MTREEKAFSVCYPCRGDGSYVERVNLITNQYITCPKCNGTGQIEIYNEAQSELDLQSLHKS